MEKGCIAKNKGLKFDVETGKIVKGSSSKKGSSKPKKTPLRAKKASPKAKKASPKAKKGSPKAKKGSPKAKKNCSKVKKCDDDKVLNPATCKCVKKDGKVGKLIFGSRKKILCKNREKEVPEPKERKRVHFKV